MRPVLVRPIRIAAALACAGWICAAACTSEVDPNAGRFSCDTQKDCGPGYDCIDQVGSDRGLCFQLNTCSEVEDSCDGQDDDCNGAVDDVAWAGEPCVTELPGECTDGRRGCVDAQETCAPITPPVAEACNQLDDDCDGALDEDFDLANDNLHCGGCGIACATGTACRFGLCAEEACGNGLDDDLDLFVDCADGDCLGQVCDPVEDRVCGLVPPGEADAGGGDGGVDPDAGMDPDAGVEEDGGFDADAGFDDAGSDGGVAPDGGDSPDAGTEDAGQEAEDGGLGAEDGGSGDDAGFTDGGEPSDAGVEPVPACVPRESACDDGRDQDGDGLFDCEDPDCEQQSCGDAGTCIQGLCL